MTHGDTQLVACETRLVLRSAPNSLLKIGFSLDQLGGEELPETNQCLDGTLMNYTGISGVRVQVPVRIF